MKSANLYSSANKIKSNILVIETITRIYLIKTQHITTKKKNRTEKNKQGEILVMSMQIIIIIQKKKH